MPAAPGFAQAAAFVYYCSMTISHAPQDALIIGQGTNAGPIAWFLAARGLRGAVVRSQQAIQIVKPATLAAAFKAADRTQSWISP